MTTNADRIAMWRINHPGERLTVPVLHGLIGTANLRDADLRGANLHFANLHFANLRGADLRSANLRYADLHSADLRYADLRYADLHSADLRYADLRFANLHSANLHSADLYFANLRDANLRDANLRSADLRGARASGETRWPPGFDPAAAGVVMDGPAPSLPTKPESLIRVSRCRGINLDPPALMMLDDDSTWASARRTAGHRWHKTEHIEAWEPVVLP